MRVRICEYVSVDFSRGSQSGQAFPHPFFSLVTYIDK